jgi:beta-N-acetylhexosaminidase
MAPRAAIFGCLGPSLSEAERAFFRAADPWGFILFARNVWSPDQLRRLTASLRETVGRDAPILIDQEGGRVARLRAPHWREWSDALDEIERCPLGPDYAETAMRLRYRLIAAELRDVGIDVNCAPLADVVYPDTHPFLRSRCYGTDPVRVMRIAVAVAHALAEGGVLPVVKHLPGHGRARADSHHELPRVTAPRAALEDTDFLPFRTFARHPLAMTAHVVYEAIDPERPATLSPPCIAAIRETIGFTGALMTDDLSMRALSGPMAARVEAALAAGCDLVLHCNGDPAEMEAVAGAAPRLAGEAARRAEAAVAARPEPDGADLAEIEARLADPRSWIEFDA